MNEQTNGWIDTALEDLAADDARVVVHSGLEAAILRAWDVEQAARCARRSTLIRAVRGWRKVAAWMLVPTAAASVLAIASLVRNPARAPDQRSPTVDAADPADVFPVAPVPTPSSERSRVTRPVARRLAANARPGSTERPYVLVPEPFADTAALHVVHVRMARMSLATLGLPIVDPDADRLVDVEMLVGDDGVARSIRKATFVREDTDRGAER
jgi:hypothetical protein